MGASFALATTAIQSKAPEAMARMLQGFVDRVPFQPRFKVPLAIADTAPGDLNPGWPPSLPLPVGERARPEAKKFRGLLGFQEDRHKAPINDCRPPLDHGEIGAASGTLHPPPWPGHKHVISLLRSDKVEVGRPLPWAPSHPGTCQSCPIPWRDPGAGEPGGGNAGGVRVGRKVRLAAHMTSNLETHPG
jgi:hypothetical protein